MSQDLHIPNLNKLITLMQTLRPDQFYMKWMFRNAGGRQNANARGNAIVDLSDCGTAACIAGECGIAAGLTPGQTWNAGDARVWLGLTRRQADELFEPPAHYSRPDTYPLWRAIATLKRLRDRFLATGEIVVDWGPEPTEGQPWSLPHAIEIRDPELPEALTRLLGGKVEA